MSSISKQVSGEVKRWGPRLLVGAAAGLVAAIPMALVMAGLNKVLPARKSSWLTRWLPLPPKQITSRLARRSGLGEMIRPGRKWEPPTWLAHLGYGAVTASLYPVVTRPLPLPGILRGMLFAMGVWATSYQGWLPAVNIMQPASEQPARRNAVLILSHLVWGSLIGLIVNQVMRRFDNLSSNMNESEA